MSPLGTNLPQFGGLLTISPVEARAVPHAVVGVLLPRSSVGPRWMEGGCGGRARSSPGRAGGGGSPRWILACWGRWVEGAGSRQSQLLGWPRATSQCLQSVHWRQTQRPWGTDAQAAAFVKRRAGQALAGAEELEDGKQGSAPPGPSPPPVCAWDPARSGFAHVQTSKPARPQCRGTEMQPQVPSEEER